MYISDLHRRILRALRHGPLNPYEIAVDLDDVAAWVVRADLQGLRRRRLVTERVTARHHDYALTDRGWKLIHLGDQLELSA